MPLAEQELPALPEHLSSSPGFSGVRVTLSLVLCVMFCRSLFVLFLLVIVLSVLLRIYRFGLPLRYKFNTSATEKEKIVIIEKHRTFIHPKAI